MLSHPLCPKDLISWPIGCSFITQSVPSHDSGVPDWFDLSIENRHILQLLCFCNNKHLEKPSVLVSLSVTLSAPFPKMTLQRLFLLSRCFLIPLRRDVSLFPSERQLQLFQNHRNSWHHLTKSFILFACFSLFACLYTSSAGTRRCRKFPSVKSI